MRRCRVVAVEPNQEMASIARRELGGHPGFETILATAEQTGLAPKSVDSIVVAQAFHWFEAVDAAREFRRILRPPGKVAVIWNRRQLRGHRFLEAYEGFLQRWSTDYDDVNSRYEPAALAALFGAELPTEASFPNHQELNLDGLRRRILSCSYIPGPGHRHHEAMLAGIEPLFDEHATDGHVTLLYDAVAYVGPPAS